MSKNLIMTSSLNCRSKELLPAKVKDTTQLNLLCLGTIAHGRKRRSKGTGADNFLFLLPPLMFPVVFLLAVLDSKDG